jgi:hypothetical protein
VSHLLHEVLMSICRWRTSESLDDKHAVVAKKKSRYELIRKKDKAGKLISPQAPSCSQEQSPSTHDLRPRHRLPFRSHFSLLMVASPPSHRSRFSLSSSHTRSYTAGPSSLTLTPLNPSHLVLTQKRACDEHFRDLRMRHVLRYWLEDCRPSIS